MSDTTSTLKIKLLSEGDLAAFEKAKERSESLKESLEGLKTALELVGVGFSLEAFAEQTKAAVEYGASLQHLAEQANISTTAFQQLAYSAAGAELSQQDLYGSLTILSRNMAQAADGASKQNRAITELGLNTAELLALPVEGQVEAIAKAYVNATDKTKAWADVTALLGKNSARARELLESIGKNGIDKDGIIISKEDIERLDQSEKTWGRIALNWKAIRSEALLLGDSIEGVISGKGIPDLVAKYAIAQKTGGAPAAEAPGESASEHQAKVEAQQKALNATIESLPQVISAHTALAKALADEGKAYETPIEASKRLRAEAVSYDDQATNLMVTFKNDSTAREQAYRLQAQASTLRKEANTEDAKYAREEQQFESALAELSEKKAQLATKLLPISQQIEQAANHQLALAQSLAALDPSSLNFRQDYLKIEGEILTVKTEISALEDKRATQAVEQAVKTQEMQNKREAIAIAAIEHDYNLTDTQKWDEKRRIINEAIAGEEKYIAQQKAIANDPNAPQGARDRAGNAAGDGANRLAGFKGQKTEQGADIHGFSAQINEGLQQAIGHADTLAQVIGKSVGNAVTQVNGGIKNWLNGTASFKSAMQSAGLQIWSDFASRAEDAFLSMLETYGLSKIKMFAIDEAMAAKGLILSSLSAAKSLIMWLPSAIAASISSYGIAAGIGAAAVIAIVAANKGGFEDGGFTGGSDGQPAGIVHGNEFVWSAPAVRAIGVGNLERAHQAALSGGSGTSGGGSGGQYNPTIVNAFSPEDVARAIRGNIDARVYRATSKIGRSRRAL